MGVFTHFLSCWAPSARGAFIGNLVEHDLILGGHGDVVLGRDRVGGGKRGVDVRLVQVAPFRPVLNHGVRAVPIESEMLVFRFRGWTWLA